MRYFLDYIADLYYANSKRRVKGIEMNTHQMQQQLKKYEDLLADAFNFEESVRYTQKVWEYRARLEGTYVPRSRSIIVRVYRALLGE